MTQEKIQERPIGVLVKTTLVDFPGRVAASLFLRGCNLRCPYCYNIALVTGTEDEEEYVSENDVINHLEKRKNVLTGFVISGGEPLLNPQTQSLIKKAKELGYKIKLDTNGMLPEILEEYLKNPELCPDFIALDVKTSPYRYGTDIPSPFVKGSAEEKIKRSIEMLSSLPEEKREFRTVLVPPLITKNDISDIAKLLPKNASWQFAQFRNENCIDKSYNDIYPYTDSKVAELVDFAQSLIPGAKLR